MPHIVLIEDDLGLARSIELELRCEGYEVTVCHNGLTGLTTIRETNPDLVLLDWGLPDFTGLEICRRLRATQNSTPLILLTARGEISHRVEGLDAGADDYMVKPFSLEELMARIRVQIRHQTPFDRESWQFEDLLLHTSTREVRRGAREVLLTPKEFDLLSYLLAHPRQVLTRSQILEQVWGYDFMGDSNVIEAYVRHLRLKLEEGGEPRLIHTVRGVGYVLRAPG